MENPSSPSASAPYKQLSQLTLIRSILLTVLWLCFTGALMMDQIKGAFHYLLGILFVFSLIHALTFLRLKKQLPVTELEFFIQLMLDILCFSFLFYFSGGANNPFISYLLVPICISAATLPWRYTWLTSISSLVSYSLLLFFYIPLPLFEINHHQQTTMNWHIIGMWFNFTLSAILITYFVVKMARTLEEQNRTLSALREDELRNQQLMAVAMLAAGAAHEMNTPLSTMTILLSELRDEHKDNPNLMADLDILKTQVKHCAVTLKQLVQDSSEANEGKFKQQHVKDFCDSIINRWQLMRPNIIFLSSFNQIMENSIIHDPRLDFAIINLLNNAADASPDGIQLEVYSEQHQLVWHIIDSGHGINPNLQPGKMILSTKEQGLGIGLLLAYAAIKNVGGSVNQTSNPSRGTTTEIRLPLL
jgi:two-component system sensor histidine kinase RegB